MKYFITYMDSRENSAKLAEEIWSALPAKERQMVYLPGARMDEEMLEQDVYFICFDYNRNVIPLEVMELITNLEGKCFACFVTSGFSEADYIREKLEQELEAFLPDDGDFRGIFLCGGCFPENIVKNAENVCKTDKDNKYAQFVLMNHEKTKNHPDAGDITDLWDFLSQNMDL